MRTVRCLGVILGWMFLAGCASTERRDAEIVLAKEKLSEFAPRLEQLREGMGRAEVERVIQAYKKGGTINISGIMETHYHLSPEVFLGLNYFTGSRSQDDGSETPVDSLQAWRNPVQVLIKTSPGREKWISLSFTPKPRAGN